MEDKITAYGDYLAGTEKADNTTALYIREAAAFIQYIGDRTVTKTLVMEYKDELMEKYRKPSTINAKIIASLFLNTLIRFVPEMMVKLHLFADMRHDALDSRCYI